MLRWLKRLRDWEGKQNEVVHYYTVLRKPSVWVFGKYTTVLEITENWWTVSN